MTTDIFRIRSISLLRAYQKELYNLDDIPVSEEKVNERLIKELNGYLEYLRTDYESGDYEFTFESDIAFAEIVDRVVTSIDKAFMNSYPSVEGIYGYEIIDIKYDSVHVRTIPMASVLDKLKEKTTVSFSVYPSTLYPMGFKRILITDPSVSARTASMYNFDAEAEHAKVIGSLPPGAPKNATDYNYLVGRALTGEYVVIGLPWIIPDSIVVETKGNGVDVYFPEVNTPEELAILKQALIANGIDNFDIMPRN